jgi:hypothetical protein
MAMQISICFMPTRYGSRLFRATEKRGVPVILPHNYPFHATPGTWHKSSAMSSSTLDLQCTTLAR